MTNALQIHRHITRLAAIAITLFCVVGYMPLFAKAQTVDYSAVCPFTWTRDLGNADEGADVLRLQQFLNADSDTQIAKKGNGSPGNESTYYGGRTAKAVSAFQEKYRSEILDPIGEKRGTGYFGSLTRLKANTLCQPVVVDELIVTESKDNPDATTLQIDKDGVSDEYTVFVFDVSAKTSDVTVENVVLDFDLYNVVSGTVAEDIVADAALYANGSQVGAGHTFELNGQLIAFSNIGLDVDANTTEQIEVALKFKSSNDVSEGTGFDVSVDSLLAEGPQGAAVAVSGTAKSAVHTLISEGLVVEFISSSAAASVAEGAGEDGKFGRYKITVDVTAIGDDVYIVPNTDSPELTLHTTTGAPASIETSYRSVQTTAPSDTTATMYIVDEGATESFTFNATYQVTSGGYYRALLPNITYRTNTNVNDAMQLLDTNVFRTSLIPLTGVGTSSNPSCLSCGGTSSSDGFDGGGSDAGPDSDFGSGTDGRLGSDGSVLGVETSRAPASVQAQLAQLKALIEQLQNLLNARRGVGQQISEVAKEKHNADNQDASVTLAHEYLSGDEITLDVGIVSYFNYYPKGDITSCTVTATFNTGTVSVTHDWDKVVTDGEYGRAAFNSVGAAPLRDLTEVGVSCGTATGGTVSDSLQVSVNPGPTGDYKVTLNGDVVASDEGATLLDAHSECYGVFNDYDTYNFTDGDVVECYWNDAVFETVDDWKG